MVVFGGKSSVDFPPGKISNQNLSPKTSPHSSLQEKKFVTWSSLKEHPRLMSWENNLRALALEKSSDYYPARPTLPAKPLTKAHGDLGQGSNSSHGSG